MAAVKKIQEDVIEFMENSSFYDEYLDDEEIIEYVVQRILDEKAYYEEDMVYWDLIEQYLDEVI